MIAVVIPLYNKEKYIGEAIQSVLQQSFTEFELIIVNDASTDNSLAVAKNFEDNRIQIITIEKSGVSAARNLGIFHAKNKWIALLDADDYWDPLFLEEMVKALEKFPSNKIIASGRTKVYKTRNERYMNCWIPKNGKTGLVNYYKIISKFLPPFNASNVLLDRLLLIEAGCFNLNQNHYEDHDLWMRICLKNEIVLVNKPLSFYRKSQMNSASQTPYEAGDYGIYLSTLLTIKKKISPKDAPFFKKYMMRFVFFSWLKYNNGFTKKERHRLYGFVSSLLPSSYVAVLNCFNLMRLILFKNGK